MKIQEQFNAWARETGLSYAQLSRISAFSIGENVQGDRYAAHGEAEGARGARRTLGRAKA